MTLSELIRTRWYPAWDSGDPVLFERVTREVFHPDAVFRRDEFPPKTLEEAMPIFLREIVTWRPQQHVMLNVIDDGGERAAWEYLWTARYSGSGRLHDGSEIPEERRFFESRAALVASWDGERCLTFAGSSGAFDSHLFEMGLPEDGH